jgi:hypothetical protein
MLEPDATESPDAPVQLTIVPAAALPFWTTLACGIHVIAAAPAATYSVGRTKETLSATALNVAVRVAPTALPCKVTGPNAVGITIVAASPVASVGTTQGSVVQAPNCAGAPLAVNVTGTPANGVTLSPEKIRTANGVAAVAPASTVPDGAETSVITSGAAPPYTSAADITVVPPVATSLTVTSTAPTGGFGKRLSGGATATIVEEVQLTTAAWTPLTVTAFPARNPIPLIVITPPFTLVAAGCNESAYNTRA